MHLIPANISASRHFSIYFYIEREDEYSLIFLLIINYYYSRLNGSGSKSTRSTRASIIASLDFFHFANFQPNYPATINFSQMAYRLLDRRSLRLATLIKLLKKKKK